MSDTTTSSTPLMTVTPEALGEAMQQVWNQWCSDTGCIPPEWTIRGPHTTRVEFDCRTGSFPEAVIETLTAMREAAPDE